MDLVELKKYMEENLVTKQEAMKITGQGISAFNQTLSTKQLVPFFEKGEGTGKVRLYLKNEVEQYAARIENRRKRLNK